MIEVLTSNVNLKEAVSTKIGELQRMKASNPYVTYDAANRASNGEQILDFTLTANSRDGKEVSIAERNVYRYVPYKNGRGENGLLLMAVSVRAYGAEAKKFLESSPTGKATLVEKIKAFKIPAISIK